MAGSTPEAGEVGGEREDLGPALLGQRRAVGHAPPLVLLLRRRERPQLGVPVGLEGVGHEAVVGVDAQVAALSQLGLVAGPLDLPVAEPVGLIGARLELGLDSQRHLERERAHGLDEQLPERAVDVAAEHLLAGRAGLLDAALLADVERSRPTVARHVAHGHALAAATADDQSLEQRRSLAGRALAPFGPVGLGVLAEARQVGLVLRPADVAGMGIEDERVPLARAAARSGPPRRRDAGGPGCVHRRRHRRSGGS